MISNKEKLHEAKSEGREAKSEGLQRWHYLAVKKLLALLRGITSKHHSDFHCLKCFHSFATENKFQSHKRVCENKDFCNIIMPSEDTKILQFNQYQKSNKVPFIIYADLEYIIEKIDGCTNNPENSSTTKVSEHIPSGFSMSTISSIRSIENKHDVYRNKDCIKKFCELLREHAMKITNFKKKKMKLLTKEQQESYENVKICYICKEKFENKYLKDKKNCKVRDHCRYTGEYRGAAHSICNLKYNVPKKIPVVFHDGPNYDYHFIIKELAEELKKLFTCLGENTEKYITFTVPIEKEFARIDKNGEKITKNISYILQFIDSTRFMASSLSNLVNNLSEGLHRIKCKLGHDNKKCETCGIKYKYCKCFLEYTNFKDDLIKYIFLSCDRSYQRKFNKKLKEIFFHTYTFSNHDNNKFILLLRKGVYPYQYMDDWEKFNETSLPEKEDCYST